MYKKRKIKTILCMASISGLVGIGSTSQAKEGASDFSKLKILPPVRSKY